jgi:hypothetical protein
MLRSGKEGRNEPKRLRTANKAERNLGLRGIQEACA